MQKLSFLIIEKIKKYRKCPALSQFRHEAPRSNVSTNKKCDESD